ncbi:FUSC family protein [Nonomuraea maritima]|uniref:FUSC family protein n=1 Tax=Nonomuraea maritima TaxID=683260 RepID=UPI0037180650
MDSDSSQARHAAAPPLERVASGTKAALRRMRTLGLERWLRTEREAFTQTIKMTGACLLAWWLAAYVLRVPLPVLAPIGVLLTMSVTAYGSLVRGAQQIGAVVVGVGAATVLIWLLGSNALTLAMMVAAGLVLTRLLNLPPQNVQVPVTGLLVFTLGHTYGLERLMDVLVGVGIGIAVNLLALPPRFVDKAAHELGNLSDELADLAQDMSTGLRDGWDGAMAAGWLFRARALERRLEHSEEAAETAADSVRLSPHRRRYAGRLHQVAEAATCLDHACNQLRHLARSLADLIAGERGLPGEHGANLPEPVADELAVLSRAFRSFSLLQYGCATKADLDDLRLTLRDGARTQEELAALLPRTGQIELRLLHGALLDDCARIRHELNPDTGPHKAAFPAL